MRTVGSLARISCFFLIFFLCSVPTVQSQDLFREMNKLKGDLATMKSELNSLKQLVFELRREILGQVADPERQARKRPPAREQQKAEKAPVLDEEQLTKIICRAVGKFFSEAESALKSSDAARARSEMHKALQRLNGALYDYSKTHRVSKLLNIYEGLAWSTYSAVQLRQSITGNQDFLSVLKKHKQRYIDTCPKQ